MSESLFTSQTPASTENDGVAYEMGMRFSSAVDGSITGIRYWRLEFADFDAVGHIWNDAGVELASVVFPTPVAADAWEQCALAAPLAIVANTNYVVSVNIGAGQKGYPFTSGGLSSQITNGNLSSVVGAKNGIFNSTAGAFPDTDFGHGNYFRDVVFEAGIADTSPEAHPFKQIISELGAGGAPIGNSSATFSATNAPTAIAPRRWITLSINGVDGYVPWFSTSDPGAGAGRWSALGASGCPTGIATATFVATNAPTAIAPRRWITLSINGVDGYVPWFSAADPGAGRGRWSELGAGGAPIGNSTATFSASNAPRAIAPRRWITLSINGVDGFIPWFS